MYCWKNRFSPCLKSIGSILEDTDYFWVYGSLLNIYTHTYIYIYKIFQFKKKTEKVKPSNLTFPVPWLHKKNCLAEATSFIVLQAWPTLIFGILQIFFNCHYQPFRHFEQGSFLGFYQGLTLIFLVLLQWQIGFEYWRKVSQQFYIIHPYLQKSLNVPQNLQKKFDAFLFFFSRGFCHFGHCLWV